MSIPRQQWVEFLAWLDKIGGAKKMYYTQRQNYVKTPPNGVFKPSRMTGYKDAKCATLVEKPEIKVDATELQDYLNRNPEVAAYLEMNPVPVIN